MTTRWRDTKVRRLRNRASEREHGASAVEFALLAPLFFMLVFGVLTGALAWNQKQQMTHAAREGARYAATLPTDTFVTPAEWVSSVRDYTVSTSEGTLTAGQVCVALVTGANQAVPGYSTGGSTCFDDGGYNPGERVQISVNRPGELWIVLHRWTFTMTSDAVGVYEG